MNPMNAANLEKALYTTTKPNDVVHQCVVTIDQKHAVTFHHGPHRMFKKEEKVDLYNVMDPEIRLEAIVRSVSELYDVVVFELLTGEFPNYPRAFDQMYRGQDYKQLGVNQLREPIWKDGTISEKYGVFYIGTSHGRDGDSGSGVFDPSGRFLGMSIAKRDVVADYENMPIGEVAHVIADHHPDTKIISSDMILVTSEIVGADPFEHPAAKKKPIN